MIGYKSRFHGDELATQGIFKWVVPIDDAKDVRCQADGHGSLFDALDDIFDECFTGSNVLVNLALREILWQNFVQKLEEAGGSLDILGNLLRLLSTGRFVAGYGFQLTFHLWDKNCSCVTSFQRSIFCQYGSLSNLESL
jgi:hypothetical protein